MILQNRRLLGPLSTGWFRGYVFLLPLQLAVALLALWPVHPLRALEVDPAQCIIVLPPQNDNDVSSAASELQKHLKLVTGLDIPVVESGLAKEGKYAFFVGIPYPADEKPLAPEEARWQVTPEGTFLYGAPKSSGVSFAVYDFLEDQLGVCWIEPGDKGIAYRQQSPLQLRAGGSSWAPELLLRKIRTSWRTGQYPDLRGRDYVRDFSEYVRSNEEHDAHAKDVAEWQKRMRMGEHGAPNYGHAFTDWWIKYGKAHPEYFALLANGKREPRLFETLPKALYTKDNPRGFQEIKMCPSSPELVQQIVKNWVDAGKRSKWINVCENDGSYGYCECEACRKLDVAIDGEKPMSHLTDRYVHLANEVAREVRKIDPEAGVVMYAYDRYMLPPRREKLEPNVAVGFVPTTVELGELEELYAGWNQTGAKLLILRPNYHTYYNTLSVPAGFEEHMFKVFQIAYKHGVCAADYDSLMGNWAVTGLSDYVLARAFSDPKQSFEHWVDQYCSAFGNASGDVKRYFEYWRNELWNKRLYPNLSSILKSDVVFARKLMPVLNKYYQPTDFDATDAILHEATKTDLSAIQREKLNQLILANQHARLTYNAAVAKGQDKNIAAVKLLDFRMAHEKDLNLNWIGTFAAETRFYGDVTGVRRAAALRDYDLPWIDTGLVWRFKMDPENIGEREKWQELTWNQTADWDNLRIDSNWENPYASETDPKLVAKLKNYDGVGWYAAHLVTPKELAGQPVYLYFDNVLGSCWVYVNGQLAGERMHNDGEAPKPFAIEIGPYLEWNNAFQNITVRVDDKGGKGGIVRPVLVVSRKPEKAGEDRQ